MVLIDGELRSFVSSLERGRGRHASADVDNQEVKRENSEPEQPRISQPELISGRRRKVEDLCRGLVVNNDHIHIIEMRLREAITAGLTRGTEPVRSVQCYPPSSSSYRRGGEGHPPEPEVK